ncbi:uncharacterized protein LOC124357051 isoform X2 [Homalodisca vitripennis]|uniref:uncharacterized protein LOC124357051 isoform X2 n=1 Tax=Homalodisca vitripennis TaxID=197043 RepID=UPI001EEA164D|nr:uncharacterized protein LOC124357051 isoform X2 [Homalodisca vitripennis]
MAAEGQVSVRKKREQESLWLCFSMSEQLQSVFRDYKLLKSLMVIGQGVASLAGIGQLKYLEELWLVDAGLHQQNALYINECPSLTRLYLYGNELTAIPVLDQLGKLTHLWLSDNRIQTLQNLNCLKSVKNLYLGNNKISNIDIKPKPILKIEAINLSGNPLHTFNEVEKLTTLKSLKTLTLWDSLFRVTPVTLLAHYRAHVIHCMPDLDSLDTVDITEAERHLVQVFYESKVQFYHLTLQHELAKLWANQKYDLESKNKELEIIWSALHCHGPVDIKTAKNKSSNLRFWEDEAQRWKDRKELCLQQYRVLAEVITDKFQIELGSSGNLQFEEDALAGSELYHHLKQKFDSFVCHRLKEKVVGVDFQKVWVLRGPYTNTLLQVKFRDVLDKVYIFGSVQDLSTSPMELAERLLLGNRVQEEVIVTGCLAAADPLLSDSAAVHRQLLLRSHVLYRIRVALLAALGVECSQLSDCCKQPHTRISSSQVVPLYLVLYQYTFQDYFKPLKNTTVSTPTPENGTSLLQSVTHRSTSQLLTKLVLTCANLHQLDIPVMEHVSMVNLSYNYLQDLSTIASIFPKLSFLNVAFNRISSLDTLQNMKHLSHLVLAWNSLKYLLPTLKKIKELSSMKHLELSYNPFQDVLSNQHELFLVCKHLSSLLSFNGHSLSRSLTSGQVTLQGQDQFPIVPDWRDTKCPLSVRWKSRLSGACGRNHLGVTGSQITSIILRNLKLTQIRSAFSLNKLKWLDLSENLISGPAVLKNLLVLEELNLSYNVMEIFSCTTEKFKNLTKLDLSHNYITKLVGINSQSFPNLEVLDLSNNQICSLSELIGLRSLVELYMSHNFLKDYEDLTYHDNAWQSLKVLDLSFNPFPRSNAYRHTCLYYLPGLEYIDGSLVEEAERKSAMLLYGGLLDQDYLMRVYNKSRLSGLTHISLTNCSIKKLFWTRCTHSPSSETFSDYSALRQQRTQQPVTAPLESIP